MISQMATMTRNPTQQYSVRLEWGGSQLVSLSVPQLFTKKLYLSCVFLVCTWRPALLQAGSVEQ